MKTINNEIEQILLDTLPKLKKFSQNKYYIILEPLLIGIELIKIPRSDNYRPHFVCYPLWKENLKNCFKKPLMLTEFHDMKGFQLSITFSNSNFNFNDIFQIIKQQIPIPFDKSISLKTFFLALDNYASGSYLSASPTSYFQALHNEHKLDIALILNDKEEIAKQITIIKNTKWNREHFAAIGIEYNKWLKSIEIKTINKDNLIDLVQENLLNNNLLKINRLRLLND